MSQAQNEGEQLQWLQEAEWEMMEAWLMVKAEEV